jgi:hypothetical protein
MSSDSMSRRDSSCFPRKRDQNWHSNLASAKFDSAVDNWRHLKERKAKLRQASAGRSRLFREKQTQTNPLRLTSSSSARYLKNRQNKPIQVNCHDFRRLGAKNALFLRFLDETPTTLPTMEWRGKTNPNKPIEVIDFVFSKIDQKSAKQTHGVYLNCFQRLTTILGADFAIFECATQQQWVRCWHRQMELGLGAAGGGEESPAEGL